LLIASSTGCNGFMLAMGQHVQPAPLEFAKRLPAAAGRACERRVASGGPPHRLLVADERGRDQRRAAHKVQQLGPRARHAAQLRGSLGARLRATPPPP